MGGREGCWQFRDIVDGESKLIKTVGFLFLKSYNVIAEAIALAIYININTCIFNHMNPRHPFCGKAFCRKLLLDKLTTRRNAMRCKLVKWLFSATTFPTKKDAGVHVVNINHQ